MTDVDVVGGKNASLGEMIGNLSSAGVDVPGGFATTAAAYRAFLATDGLDERIGAVLDGLDVDDIDALTAAGRSIRGWIIDTALPERLKSELRQAWDEMSGGADIAVAVRSSATAEDLPDASFAGQQETFLNVRGFDSLVVALHKVFASLFNDRAIAYRVHQGFDHRRVALSAGIQTMVRSDIGIVRRHVQPRHRERLPECRVHHGILGTRRDRRPGRRQSGRVLCLQAGTHERALPDPAPESRQQGDQDGLQRRHDARRDGRDRRRRRGAEPTASRSATTTSSRWRGWP